MKFNKLLILFSVCTFACLSQAAQAGLIRYAGKQIAKGTGAATQAVAASSAAAAGGTTSAGYTVLNAAKNELTGAEGAAADAAAGGMAAGGAVAGNAIANTAAQTGSVLKSAPGAAASGTTAVARKVWRFVW